ncbi:MAG TPA: fibronectin type III domain-containing protein [Solirubrobacteraceae bacterium]|nr:fibronectin type III domain-containing protein [Solirubrobacteraceae bacterium]
MLRGSGAIALACAAGIALTAPASAAAARPAAVTGGVDNVGQQNATLTARVDGNGRQTSYVFEYGPTTAYGASTTPAPTGDPRRAVQVRADIAGLVPFTVYHYRVVATNRDGRDVGRDRTFRTAAVPLGLTLGANPNPVIAGRATTLSGVLAGSQNAGRRIRLVANAFPYTTGFQTVGNEVLTDAQGNFAFPILSLPVTTQFQVQVSASPEVQSAILTVGAAVRVTTRVRRKKLRRGVSARFAGRIFPARDGVLVEIQRRLPDGQWRTMRRTFARHARPGYSRYVRRVRVRARGIYRVLVTSEGQYVSNASREVLVRSRMRGR